VKYLKNILIGLDQTLNSVIGGQPDETISAKCWRMRGKSKGWAAARYMVDKLFWFDDNHCRESYETEKNKMQLPEEYRG
jgi:hypothetical protein